MQQFRKNERLCSKKVIDALFVREKSRSLSAYPFKLIWLPASIDNSAQVLFTVPKRKFKRAHDRNRIKRMMREAYRLNKESLYASLKQSNTTIAIALLYTGSELPDWKEVSGKIIVLLQRLSSELNSPAATSPQP